MKRSLLLAIFIILFTFSSEPLYWLIFIGRPAHVLPILYPVLVGLLVSAIMLSGMVLGLFISSVLQNVTNSKCKKEDADDN